ncbi:MAG: hypothetical protein MJ076_02720 [Clostridia bacterium]|nr:hypothetical protein [Clostridia bacterium]
MTLMDLGIKAETIKVLVYLFSAFITIGAVVALLLWIVRALGLYNMALKVGNRKSWYAFLPFLNLSLTGKMAGNYRGKKGLDSWLLFFYIIFFVLAIIATVMLTAGFVDLLFSAEEAYANDTEISVDALRPIIYAFAVYFCSLFFFIIYRIFMYVCLYSLYDEFDHKNRIVFIVLSILFNPLVPFFLLSASKKKELTYEDIKDGFFFSEE